VNDSRKNSQLNSIESFTTMSDMFAFLIRTYDGWYLIAISVGYVCFGLWIICGESSNDLDLAIAFLAYPIVLFLIYVRHRIGTRTSDFHATAFTVIGLTVIAVAPIYVFVKRVL
jgi:hypothetical protein